MVDCKIFLYYQSSNFISRDLGFFFVHFYRNVMSWNNKDLSTVNDNTSADVFDNSNEHGKSTSDVIGVSDNGWANFETVENDTNNHSEVNN